MANTDQALNNLQAAITTAAGLGAFALDADFLNKGLADPAVKLPEKYDDIIGQAFQIKADAFLISCQPGAVGPVTDGSFTISTAQLPFIGNLLNTAATLVFSSTSNAASDSVLVVQIQAIPANWSWGSSFPFMGGWPFDQLNLSAVQFIFSTADGVYPWGQENGISVVGGARQNLNAQVPLPTLAIPLLALFPGLPAPGGNLSLTGALNLGLYDGSTFETGTLMPSGNISASLSEAEFNFAGYLKVKNPSLTLNIPEPSPPPGVNLSERLLWDADTQSLLATADTSAGADIDLDQAPTLALTCDLEIEGADLSTYQLAVMIFPDQGQSSLYSVALTAGKDGPPLSPAVAISLVGGGGSYFRATPAVLQQFLSSFGLDGMSISGALTAPPSVTEITVQLGSVPGLNWQPIPAPTPALSFTITSFFLNWAVSQPFKKPKFTYQFGSTFTLLPTVFKNMDGTDGGEFSITFNSALLFEAGFDGKASLTDFLNVVSNGAISLPSSIKAELSNIKLALDGTAQSFEFSSDFDIALSFLTVGGYPILQISGGAVSLSGLSATAATAASSNALATQGAGTAWAGQVSGLLGIGPLQANCVVAYDGQQTPPRWNLSAELTQPLQVEKVIQQFFAAGGIYDFPDFLPGDLTILSFAVTSTIPTGQPSQALATSYSVDTSFSWKFKLGEQDVFGLEKATIGVKYDGAKLPAQQFSGSASTTWIYSAINLKLTFGYTFQPTAEGPNNILFVTWEGFTASYTTNTQMLSFTMNGWSLGTLIQSLVRTLGNPYFTLPSPWDLLNQISLDGLAINVSLKDGVQNRLSGSYTLSKPLNLGFIVINKLILTRGTDGKVTLALDATVPPLLAGSMGPLIDPSKGQNVQDMPQVPGQGSSYFKVFLLVLGQRVSIYGSPSFDSTAAVIKALQNVPSTTGKDNPVNPGGTQVGQPYYNANSNWLIATHLGVLQTAGVWAVDLQLVFNDPNLYGMRLALGSAKMGGLAGLVVDILYKKITDDIGLFQIDFTFPDSIRNLNFGAVSVVLPMIGIKIYTNGDFVIDIGFPYNLDFSRSFSFSAIVYGVPVLGSGGVYFGKLSNATATQVPKTDKGSFNPVIIFGLGLQIGLGYNFVKGPLKAGFALTVFGIIEGVIATYRPYDNSDNLPAVSNTASVQESHYFKIKGTVGVIGLLYGEVDLKIISASLLVNITVSVQIVYESYRAIPLSVTASVKISLKVKIDLGIFSFSISVSFSATVSAKFVIGSDSRAPWDKANTVRGLKSSYGLPTQARFAADVQRYAVPMRLAPVQIKPKLNLYVSPQFTVLAPENANSYQQQQGAFICLLAMDAPDSTAAVAGTGTSSFDYLCAAYFPWLLNLLQSETSNQTQVLDLLDAQAATVSRDKLEADMNWLGDAANTAFSIKDLLQFLADGFILDILPATQLPSATLFPAFDGLQLSVPDPAGGSTNKTIALETYTSANSTYRELVANTMREVAANVASRQKAPKANLLSGETAESMAAFVFVDVFTLIGRALLQAGIDAFNNYAYPLTKAESINGIITTLNSYGNLIELDDIALPNADYALTDDLTITLSQLSNIIQSKDDLNAVAARYTDSINQRWLTSPAQLIIANPDARILRADTTFTVVIGNTLEPYTTKPGDSFASIAAALKISLKTLSEQAVLYNLPDLLLPTGQIAIPDLQYRTASDTLNSIASAFALSVSGIAQSNRDVADLFVRKASGSHLAVANVEALPVSLVWDAIQATGAVGQVAAQVARFVTYGLRLPKAAGLSLSGEFLYTDQQSEYALYQLTGQQFPTPDPAKATAYSITVSRADESHDVNLDFIQFASSADKKIDIKLDDAYALLNRVLAYARSGKFLPSPSCQALPPIAFKPKQFVSSAHAVWNSSDQNRINQVTRRNGSSQEQAQSAGATPYLWNLPQAMLTSIQERQATLETVFDEADYAKLLPLLPAYLPRIGNTPPNSSKTVYADMESYAYASRVDFQITRLPANTSASTTESLDNSATLEAATAMATVYQVLGPSAADAQRLQFLLTAMASVGEDLVSGLFLLYSQGGNSTPSLTSQADSEFLAFLTQTNLSTESNPPPSRQALFRALKDVPHGIANTPSQFIKLLWEQSVVRGGGYYLYWQELASGSGLPASIFDATGTATLSLLVTIDHDTLPANGKVVPNFVNAFVSNQNIDLQQDVVVLESQVASGDSNALSSAATQSLSSIGLLYGVAPSRLAIANDEQVLSPDRPIPVTGIIHQLSQTEAADPATALDRLAAYYAVGMQSPLMTGADIARHNPGVNVAVGASFVIPPFTYLVSSNGPGNRFASMAAYYHLSPEALAASAAQVPGIFPDGAILDIETQVLTVQASQDPGNVAFVLERDNPDSQQFRLKASADDSPGSILYGLYNTLAAGLQTNPYFLSSPYSLPFGPQDYSDDDDQSADASHQAAMQARSARMAQAAENDFEYRQALGYNGKNSEAQMFARINPAPTRSAPGLPSADANPYVGVGTYLSVALRWLDLFGNTTITPFELVPPAYGGALNNMPIALHYTDRLTGISAWPKTQTTYIYSGTAGNPVLQVLLRMDGNPYTDRQDILNDLASYQSIYFQLNQDYTGLGVPGLSGNAVSISLVNSLLSSPTTELKPAQTQTIRDYVAACAAYLQAMLDTAQNAALPVAPQSSLSIPFAVSAIVSQNLIALDVSLVFSRKAELVTPQIAALTDGIAVSSAILPQADSKAETSSYTQFATALETCLQTSDWYIKAGNGLTQAGNSERMQTQQIFAVRFGRSAGKGIYFQIAEQAAYYAPLPIAKSLSSNTVIIKTYPDNEQQSLSFNGIDQNLWFENCLNAIDKFLSPSFAPAAFILDKINQVKDPLKDGDLGKVLAAKQKLADAISATVSPILSTSAADDSTRASAKETMRQQLLTTLGSAFSAGAVVVYGLEQVGGADGSYPSGPPSLYGQPTTPDGAGAGKNQNFSLSPARIPLAASAGLMPRLAFNFTSKNVADQAYVPLDMNYQITHMEFDRSNIPGIENYVASQWLGFINGPLQYALGKSTQYIPVMNRALPVPPTANNQTALATPHGSGTLTPADLAMWDYGFNYNYQQAAQDAIHINIVLNVPGAAFFKNTVTNTDLFGALAEFVTNYPAISADLDNYLVKIDGQTDDEALVKKATQATSAFQALVNQVADVYAEQFGMFRAALPNGTSSVPISFEALLNSDADGNARYEIIKLSIRGIAATYDSSKHTISNGDITLPAVVMEVLPQQYQATPILPVPAGALFAYTYLPIPPASGEPLSYDVAKNISNWTVSLPDLNVMMYQNARSSMYVQRNKFLFPVEQAASVQTMPEFLYQTPEVKFTDPILPRITYPQYDLRQLSPESGSDINAYMSSFFKELFSNASGKMKLTMSGGYSYSLVPSMPDMARTSLPINLLPSTTIQIDPKQAPPEAMALTGQVANWYADNQPTTTGAAAMDFDLKFFSAGEPEQLLLAIERLYWNVEPS